MLRKYEVADMLCIGDDEKSDAKKDDAAEDESDRQLKLQLIQRKMLNSQPEQK